MSPGDHLTLDSIMHEVILSKRSQNYTAVNQMFDKLSVKDSELLMIGFLRSTFSIRSQVTNWQSMLVRVYDELERRGQDAPRFLRGLF